MKDKSNADPRDVANAHHRPAREWSLRLETLAKERQNAICVSRHDPCGIPWVSEDLHRSTAQVPDMFTVAEINSLDQLASFSLTWQSLWDRTPQRSFFQTREWLDLYWRTFGEGRKFRILLVMSALRPIGIVPLVIKRVKTTVGTLRVLTYPLDGWGPYFGPIGSDPTATMFGALKHLSETQRDWDLLDLRGVDDDQLDKGRTANAFRLSGLRAKQRVWEEIAEIAVSAWSTGEQFLLRRRLQDAEKQLWQLGGWEFSRSRVLEADLPANLECRSSFEEARSLLTPRGMPFAWLADVHESALRTGAVEICHLWLSGRLIAAALNTVTDGRVIPISLGMAPVAKPDVAKTVFLGRMLFDGLNRGDECYLFGARASDWAHAWQPTIRRSYRFTHFSGYQPQAQLLRLNEFRKGFWPRQTQTTGTEPLFSM